MVKPIVVALLLAALAPAQAVPGLVPLVDAPMSLAPGAPPPFAIAPGGWLFTPNWCTLGFVFAHRDTGALAISTAGHCIAVGERAEQLVVEPTPGGDDVSILRPIGTAIVSSRGGVGHDFALIAIDPSLAHLVDPGMDRARGPCGAHEGPLATGPSVWPAGAPFPVTVGGLPLAHVGHGVAVGTGGTARAATGDQPRPEQTGTSHFALHGLVAAGDSGSPVRLAAHADTPLAAVGILTHALVLGSELPAGHAFGTSLAQMERLAGPSWRLVDDPLCPDLL